MHSNASKSGANCYIGTKTVDHAPQDSLQPLTATFIHATLPFIGSKTSLQVMDTSVGSTSASRCACCGSDASMRCSGCIGAPEYEDGDGPNTTYCNRDCQREHWNSHKAQCKILQQRKKLLRAAQILKAALLTFREATYDIDLTGVHYESGTLWLHQKQRSISTRSKRGPFPNHLVANVQHKEAVLAHNSCTTAMSLLGRMTRKLLQRE